MKKITCIGSSHYEEDVILEENFDNGTRNEGQVYSGYGGTMRNVAHNLALMGLPVSLCTKLGNDMDGVNIWNQLHDLGVSVSGPTVDLPTPKKISIFPKDGKQTIFWDKPKDFFFHYGDVLPISVLEESDYCVTDMRSNELLLDLIDQTPHAKWVVSHYVPNKEVLSHLHGIVINYADALKLGKPSDFERICYRLCLLGLKFVVINMNFQGAYVYTNNQGKHYPTKCHGDGYFNGCYSAFLSGFVAGLSLDTNLETATKIALSAQGLTYKSPYLINPQIGSIFKKPKAE